jgi:RNA polymerase primary sigma factor
MSENYSEEKTIESTETEPDYLIEIDEPINGKLEETIDEELVTVSIANCNDKEILTYLTEKMKQTLEKNPELKTVKKRNANYQLADLAEYFNLESEKDAELLVRRGYVRENDGKIRPTDIINLQKTLLERLGLKTSSQSTGTNKVGTVTNGRTHSPSQKEDTIVDSYFRDIEKSMGLSAEEEIDLAEKIQAGDESALKKLVEANLRFVVSVAKQYQNCGLPLSDLIGAGNLGLMTAAKRFDGEKGFKFISYGVWWIRQTILQDLAENSRIVRLPLNRIGELTKINKEIAKLEQEGIAPEQMKETLAERLDMTENDVVNAMKSNRKPLSLDQKIEEDGEDTWGDVIPDETQDIEKEILDEKLKEEIEEKLGELTEQEAEILRRYYGLNGRDAMTLEQIGESMGRTRERIRQIKEKTLQKLRHPKKSENLKDYYQ